VVAAVYYYWLWCTLLRVCVTGTFHSGAVQQERGAVGSEGAITLQKGGPQNGVGSLASPFSCGVSTSPFLFVCFCPHVSLKLVLAWRNCGEGGATQAVQA
jgi:hypothetical protein